MKCHCKQYVLCMYPQKNQWNYTTVSVVFQRALGYYMLWVITCSKLVTLFYHLLRTLGYYAHIVVIYDFIKLKYSIFKILFRIIFELLRSSE